MEISHILQKHIIKNELSKISVYFSNEIITNRYSKLMEKVKFQINLGCFSKG